MRNLQGQPAPEALRSDSLQAAESLRVEARGGAPELEDDEGKLLTASTYLIRDAEFPGYKMRPEHRMVIFLIFDGERTGDRKVSRPTNTATADGDRNVG